MYVLEIVYIEVILSGNTSYQFLVKNTAFFIGKCRDVACHV